MNDVGIWLYKIPKCGYFPWRTQANQAPLFGGGSQTFSALAAWADGKLLGQTSTFTAQEGDDRSNVYFLGCALGTHGDFLVAVWNRLQGNQNDISSVGLNDPVGTASAEKTAIDHTRIPGYATYFWVMPSEGKIAALRLKHTGLGLANFILYVTSFLKYINPEHVVPDPVGPNGETKVRYRQDATQAVVQGGVRPTFGIKSIPLQGDIAYLRANVASISAVECKTTLSTTEPQQFTWWQTLLDVSRVGRRQAAVVLNAPIKIEVPVTFTQQQLDATIESWEDDIDNGKVNDLGFVIGGQTKWLSKAHARTTVPLDVLWIDDELVNIEALLGQLQVHRAAVLALG